jgi:hypothetical protein
MFTEPLPSSERGIHFTERLKTTIGWIHIQTYKVLEERYMKHAVETGSGAMMHIPTFIKIGSRIQKLIEVDSQIRRQTERGDCISLFYFFQNKESRLKTVGSVSLKNRIWFCTAPLLQ